jgi:hypothetical protein
LAGDLYALVVHIHKNCNADLFEAVGALDLSFTQIKLLHYLGDTTSLPAASRMVDDLVRRGFVERHEDHEDRRMKRVRVTESARAVIRSINAARLSGLEQFALGLTDAERRALADALDELLKRPEVAACRPVLTQ